MQRIASKSIRHTTIGLTKIIIMNFTSKMSKEFTFELGNSYHLADCCNFHRSSAADSTEASLLRCLSHSHPLYRYEVHWTSIARFRDVLDFFLYICSDRWVSLLISLRKKKLSWVVISFWQRYIGVYIRVVRKFLFLFSKISKIKFCTALICI